MTGHGHAEAPPGDIRAADWAIGLMVAAAVLVGAAVALEAAHLGRRADAPPIDPGLGIPIAVEPVLESPGASRRGSAVQTPSVPRVRRRARGSGSASSPGPAPAAEAGVAAPASPGGKAGPAARRPGSATSSTPNPEAALPSVADDPSPSDDEPAPSDTAADGHEAPGAADGPSDDPSAGTAEAGPSALEAQAIAAYRDRISRWLSARFTVTDSGLTPAERQRHRVRAMIRISAEGSVESYEVIPSGNAAFDRGALEALQSVVGEPLPIPPDHYPRAVPRELKVTFVCSKSQCS